MRTPAADPDELRHRLLEGVVLRLARRPDAGAFVLRGGLLMRHWFRPVPRPVEDLDLVATFPFSVNEAEKRFLPVLADEFDDEVTFDPERTRVEGIWLGTGAPGARVFTSGTAAGTELDFHVDITFGPPPRPAPVLYDLPTASGGARLLACRPEAVAGQKVQALRHRGALGWRAKDLYDLYLLLARVEMSVADLRTALAAYLADVRAAPADAKALFASESWWDTKMASARWFDYVKPRGVPQVPRDLADVIAEINARLAPVWEGTQ